MCVKQQNDGEAGGWMEFVFHFMAPVFWLIMVKADLRRILIMGKGLVEARSFVRAAGGGKENEEERWMRMSGREMRLSE